MVLNENYARSATLSATYVGKNSQVYNVKDHGLVGDAVQLNDCAVTVGANRLTSLSANFTSADVGKVIGIGGAGTSGGSLNTSPTGSVRTILSVVDAHTIDFDDPLHGVALTTVVGPRTCTTVTVRGVRLSHVSRRGVHCLRRRQDHHPNHRLW